VGPFGSEIYPRTVPRFVGITDCHVHINPYWEMHERARGLLGHGVPGSDIQAYVKEPRRFLDYLDRCGVDRAVLVNYVAPEVIGYTTQTNQFVGEYARADPQRLIAIGSVLPSHHEPGEEVRRIVREYGIRGIKIHPPHQLFAPNAYTDGRHLGLQEIYATCEELRLPVIIHTGTSVFPGARNKFGHPMLVEDVAIDYPELTIVLAHGGRPLWMAEAEFLTRRFPKVFLELSSIPPKNIPKYFPQLDRLADQVLFGTDWPGPGVKDVKANVEAFEALPLDAGTKRKAMVENPERVFPRSPPSAP
jgi:uncharacterized protein